MIMAADGVTNTFSSWYRADRPEVEILKPNSFGEKSSPSLSVKSVLIAMRHTKSGKANCKTVMRTTDSSAFALNCRLRLNVCRTPASSIITTGAYKANNTARTNPGKTKRIDPMTIEVITSNDVRAKTRQRRLTAFSASLIRTALSGATMSWTTTGTVAAVILK